jgi:Fuc2NAc and GlcNAc transferase
MQIIISVLLSFLSGGLGAFLIRTYGSHLGIVDVPNERSSHTMVVPKGGGVGILAAFVLCSLFLRVPGTFWGPALCLSMVSFWGDRHEILPKYRLIIQFACSLLFLVALFHSMEVHSVIYLAVLPLSVFIVGTSNFYNFMDGINGVAAITGIVAFSLLAVYGSLSGADPVYLTVCIVVAFSCAGFLPFNVPNATVFMGDIGSILLGFVFACLVILFSRSVLDFICMAGFLFPFYADELTTMAVRIKSGESLSRPHRRHLYQLLVNEYGINHWKVSAGYGIVQFMIGAAIILFRNSGGFQILLLLLVCFLVFSILSFCIRMKLKGT